VSRNFGAVNPIFAYSVSGFVNGDTSSVVTGSPACSTTAVVTSTGGNYPITCTQGTLSASNYTFVETTGTLTVTYSSGSACLSGLYLGYTVQSGQSVCFGPNATVDLILNVEPGGSVDIEGATVNAINFAGSANVVRVCSATILGAVIVQGSTGYVDFGDGGSCAGSRLLGSLTLQSDTGGVSVQGLNVLGALTVSSDSGGITVSGNTVNGTLVVDFNSGAITVSNNHVTGITIDPSGQ